MNAPWPHQTEDTGTLIRERMHLLGLRPGLGKSRIVVDAAQALYLSKAITQLLIVAPAAVRSVWVDPDPVLGEWAKWADPSVPSVLTEYSGRAVGVAGGTDALRVLVTNPEMMRRPEHLKVLRTWAGAGRTMLAVDESWQYQNPQAAQTKALYLLRSECGRVVLLNGTPGEPKHLFAQYQILSPQILECANWWQFRGRFCNLGGYMAKEIVGYKNLDEFHRRTAPYTTIRDIRTGATPVHTQIEARLTPATWRIYRELEADMLSWLDTAALATASQAGVRAMRLAQIVNGFVGGIEYADDDLLTTRRPETVREVGSEKFDALLTWLGEMWHDPKLVIFTRFRPDVERTATRLAAAYPAHRVNKLYGSQAEDERHEAKLLLAPDGDERPAIVVANAQSGGAGLNLAAASLCVFLGHDYSYRVRTQAEGRVDRPGQKGHVTFLDVLATGPKGERTIDHIIVAALRRQEDLQAWSPAQWRAALEETHGQA